MNKGIQWAILQNRAHEEDGDVIIFDPKCYLAVEIDIPPSDKGKNG
jgi:hypothetical protein